MVFHAFLEPGVYTVRVDAINPCGAGAYAEMELTVTEAPAR